MSQLSASLPLADQPPQAWSRLQVILHWLVVGLIVLQYIDSESMEALFEATFEGERLSALDSALGWTHIVAGSAILAAMVIRLIARAVKGRPPHDAGESYWPNVLARVTHALLYATLLAMPVLGLGAWITGNETFAELHTLLWTPLLILIGLHVAGALVQHFWFRTDALRRMTSLRRRTVIEVKAGADQSGLTLTTADRAS